MKLTMLGTGNALVTECYNTCFILEENNDYFMVDGGGGNTILRQLKHAGINWKDVHTIFVTHKHVDHITGIFWMIRMACQYMRQKEYVGELTIYSHQEVIDILDTVSRMLLNPGEIAFIGKRVHLVPVHDGESKEILDHKVTFFDIRSNKAKQYGFTMDLGDGEKLTCCGDEPLNPDLAHYVEGSKWLLHEAFCLFSEADVFHPYEKQHSTVKDSCKLAEDHHVKNLILYHTEDKNLAQRKDLYTQEGKDYFSGNLYIPEDLKTILL